MHFFDTRIAKQADVAGFCAAYCCIGLQQHQLSSRTETGFDAQPSFFQNYLGQADQETNAQTEYDKTDGQRAFGQQFLIRECEEDAAYQAADDSANYTVDDLSCRLTRSPTA